jgi:hypothetical protein
VLIAILLVTTACVTVGQIGEGGEIVRGSGDVTTETREVSGFTGIRLTGGGEIIIEQGDSEGLTIEAEDNLLEYLTSDVSGDTLELSIEEGYTLRPTRSIIYRISVIDLEGIEVEGGATITAENLSLDTLDINITGGGMLDLSGTVEDMATRNGDQHRRGGHLTVRAETLDVTINGAGRSATMDPEVSHYQRRGYCHEAISALPRQSIGARVVLLAPLYSRRLFTSPGSSPRAESAPSTSSTSSVVVPRPGRRCGLCPVTPAPRSRSPAHPQPTMKRTPCADALALAAKSIPAAWKRIDGCCLDQRRDIAVWSAKRMVYTRPAAQGR